MRIRELQQAILYGEHVIKTVDEDGFVRDIVSASVDDETGCLVLRLEIQKKNGEIE